MAGVPTLDGSKVRIQVQDANDGLVPNLNGSDFRLFDAGGQLGWNDDPSNPDYLWIDPRAGNSTTRPLTRRNTLSLAMKLVEDYVANPQDEAIIRVVDSDHELDIGSGTESASSWFKSAVWGNEADATDRRPIHGVTIAPGQFGSPGGLIIDDLRFSRLTTDTSSGSANVVVGPPGNPASFKGYNLITFRDIVHRATASTRCITSTYGGGSAIFGLIRLWNPTFAGVRQPTGDPNSPDGLSRWDSPPCRCRADLVRSVLRMRNAQNKDERGQLNFKIGRPDRATSLGHKEKR